VLIARGNTVLVRSARRGCFAVRSIRSLFFPGLLTSRLRSPIVGRALARRGRSSRRNGASLRVAGFDTSTSCSRSSSVERRFTNVVLPLRSVSGSSSRARSSAALSAPIAPKAVFALLTRSARSSRRSAIADTAVEVSVTKRSRIFWSRASSRVRLLVLTRKGLKYLVASRASSPLPSYWSPKPRTTFRRPLRVRASRVLKSVSMSTGALVSSAPISPPSSISPELFGPGWRET
jgi:hypothetical protein